MRYDARMKIRSAKFIKGVVSEDELLEDGKPQIAMIGRSNVGKSSIINSLTGQKNLARTSSFPGRTREINLFLINNKFYLVDLPGYGFARGSGDKSKELRKLISWYLFESPYKQKLVVFIVDADVGPTDKDINMLRGLKEHHKNIVIVANKVDKIRKSQYKKNLQKIRDIADGHKVIPFSSDKKIGISALTEEIFKK